MNKRLVELDFLRGIAILLVICRHQVVNEYLEHIGWIGVDLFFVLSGFLVSGLLFKEYKKFGNVNVKLFLIRRGFKIYPIYYLSLPLYILAFHRYNLLGIFFETIFLQNYAQIGGGLAYVSGPNWSLAIEEHFYFGFAFLIWASLKYKKIQIEGNFIGIIIKTIVAVFFIRLLSNIFYNDNERNIAMTHLRIDSLLTGVVISYFYYFRRDYLEEKFNSYKKVLLLICFLGLLWTPFIEPTVSFFARTAGFTLLYISFGILLVYFLVNQNIHQLLNRIFTPMVVNVVSKIGYCSYSIYIIHTFIIKCVFIGMLRFHLGNNIYLSFLFVVLLSVLAGILMTKYLEGYFLKLRDKYFPSRVLTTVSK